MNQKNKDLPALPVHPIQDKFGQIILMAGMTKYENSALQILCTQLRRNKIEDLSDEDISFLIEQSYKISEEFCEYQETKIEAKSIIV